MAIFPDADPSKPMSTEDICRVFALPPHLIGPSAPAVRATVGGLSFAVVEEGERWDGCPNCAEKDAEIREMDSEIKDLRQRLGEACR